MGETAENLAEKWQIKRQLQDEFAFESHQKAIIAQDKGFFKDENLDPVLIQMRSQVTVPALMSGEVNYTLSFGNILTGAMQGMPFKILAVLTPLHHIVARRRKRLLTCAVSVSALKGSAGLITSLRKRFQAKGMILRKSNFNAWSG
jgi:hypothetical protein